MVNIKRVFSVHKPLLTDSFNKLNMIVPSFTLFEISNEEITGQIVALTKAAWPLAIDFHNNGPAAYIRLIDLFNIDPI